MKLAPTCLKESLQNLQHRGPGSMEPVHQAFFHCSTRRREDVYTKTTWLAKSTTNRGGCKTSHQLDGWLFYLNILQTCAAGPEGVAEETRPSSSMWGATHSFSRTCKVQKDLDTTWHQHQLTLLRGQVHICWLELSRETPTEHAHPRMQCWTTEVLHPRISLKAYKRAVIDSSAIMQIEEYL